MFEFLFGATIVLFVALVYIYFRKAPQQTLPDSHIRVYIPFEATPALDLDALMKAFTTRWSLKVNGGEAPDSTQDARVYLLVSGPHHLRITVSSAPIADGVITSLKSSVPFFPKHEKPALPPSHQAHMALEYLVGTRSDDATARVTFTAQTLLILADLPGALGFINDAARTYTRSGDVARFTQQTLEPLDLYALFTDVRVLPETDTKRWHTLGLEQFALPNLHLRYEETTGRDIYPHELITEAALQMLEHDPIKSGEVLELKGNGVMYVFREVPDGLEIIRL